MKQAAALTAHRLTVQAQADSGKRSSVALMMPEIPNLALPQPGNSSSELRTPLEQIANHLELAERSLKAHHEKIMDLVARHLDPLAASSTPDEPSPRTDAACRSSVDSLMSLNPRQSTSQRQPVPPLARLSRAVAANPLFQDASGRPVDEVPAAPRAPQPDEQAPRLPGQAEEDLGTPVPIRHQNTALSAGRGSLVSAIRRNAKLTLLPVWAHRYDMRHGKSNEGNERDALPVTIIEDDDEGEPHTIRTETCMRHVILHPLRIFRMIWDILSLIMVLYDIIMIPMGFFDLPPDDPVLKAFEWVTRIFWTMDIPMSFFSGFVMSDGVVEMRPVRIIKRYLKTWFLLDALVVGVDWMEIVMSSAQGSGVARMGKASRPFRIIRMIRLLRLARMTEIVNLLLERLPSDLLVVFGDIIKLIITMLAMGHLIGCLWWAVGQATPEGGSWIDTVTGPLADSTWRGKSLGERYLMSFRWALSQFAGGMDEVVPFTFEEHLFATAIFVISFWSGTVFMSILTSHMTQLFIIGSQQTQQLSMLRRYLSQHGVSRTLALRAQRNAQHVMNAQSRTMSEQAVGLLDLVSKALRIELHYEMYSPVLSVHPFFNDYMLVCPHVVRKICHAALSINANSAGDVIFHFGETASAMILVKSGRLRYSWGPAKEPSLKDIKENNYISEAALWVHWSHRGGLTVAEDSILIAVNAEAFQCIVGQFEQTSFDPAEYAAWFVAKTNESQEEVTDLPIKDTEDLPIWLTRHSRAINVWKAQSRATRHNNDPMTFLDSDDDEPEGKAEADPKIKQTGPGQTPGTNARGSLKSIISKSGFFGDDDCAQEDHRSDKKKVSLPKSVKFSDLDCDRDSVASISGANGIDIEELVVEEEASLTTVISLRESSQAPAGREAVQPQVPVARQEVRPQAPAPRRELQPQVPAARQEVQPQAPAAPAAQQKAEPAAKPSARPTSLAPYQWDHSDLDEEEV